MWHNRNLFCFLLHNEKKSSSQMTHSYVTGEVGVTFPRETQHIIASRIPDIDQSSSQACGIIWRTKESKKLNRLTGGGCPGPPNSRHGKRPPLFIYLEFSKMSWGTKEIWNLSRVGGIDNTLKLFYFILFEILSETICFMASLGNLVLFDLRCIFSTFLHRNIGLRRRRHQLVPVRDIL